MDPKLYEQHAQTVLTVFEMLRLELANECDDSAVLNRLHEIAILHPREFFLALEELADRRLNGQPEPGELLARCAPLKGIRSA